MMEIEDICIALNSIALYVLSFLMENLIFFSWNCAQHGYRNAIAAQDNYDGLFSHIRNLTLPLPVTTHGFDFVFSPTLLLMIFVFSSSPLSLSHSLSWHAANL